MKLLADYEDDIQESNGWKNIEIAIYGTVWKKIETSSSPGRPFLHTILKDVLCPTVHAKLNIMMGKLTTAFMCYLIIILCI